MSRKSLRSLVIATASAAVLGLATMPASAQHSDRFDTETVGTFPSTWTYTVNPGVPFTAVVVTDAAAPSQPNSFETNNSSDQSFEHSRFFAPQATPLNLFANGPVRFGYSLNVTQIPDGTTDGNEGPNFAFGLGSGGGYSEGFGGATLRIFSNGADTTKWDFYDANQGAVLAILNVGTFYDITLDFNPTGPTTGTYQWGLNGINLGPVYNYTTGPSESINGFRLGQNTGTGSPDASVFRLDNVYLVPEPASFGLLSLSGLMFLRRRRR